MGFLQRLFVFAVMALRGVRCFAPVPRHARHAVPRAGLDPEIEAQTKKWGLEGGLFAIFKSDKEGEGKGSQAKQLLKEYGAAYLLTSISLSAVSFGACYVLVDAGVDVPALLAKLQIDATATTEKAGTLAIAYAAHKAASPIRFPPTVALTPIVAKLLKGEKAENE
ncbi:hypothetical protein M885DRAFT_506242 [Pelagophyceae sp. CCMP2097]|nr:hypothetical protein M885DRAFT_506242 [Pelagophyceae sp. CCMP2097]|mmetsp:Transcript_11781/g.39327  ORF Transcript_11781/g.39327 Transcript_11781/m.39327 type:complete len:166 (+) Transcript_11781:167-664(+)